MFTFEKCTYDELQVIRYEADLLLSGWTMLEKIIQFTEKKDYREKMDEVYQY